MVKPDNSDGVQSWILDYYSNPTVSEELFNYGRNRWIAIEGYSKRRVFMRYNRNGLPLQLKNPSDVIRMLKGFWFVRPRSFYGSINEYGRLSTKEDLEDISNILRSTPTWDVDNEVERWHETIKMCRLIVDELEREKVVKSLYLKWSGRGCHIHLSEKALSEEILRRYGPLDIAFAIVEYIIRKAKPKLTSLQIEGAKVENKVDLKRVFTLPLSLHRELDYSCVCFIPDEMESFDISWANPKYFRHKPTYDSFEVGEGDELAEKALSEVGGYFRRVAPMPNASKERMEVPKLGRFQVMALLQAARCFLFTNDIEKSKSFGLNRAIFYAWAKHRGAEAKKPSGRREAIAELRERPIKEEKKAFYLGNEAAYLSEDGWLTIGNAKQTPQDYDNQIARRINEAIPYEEAWRRSLEYLKKFPQEALLDQQKFFNQIYKPVRDSFIETVYRKETRLRKLR